MGIHLLAAITATYIDYILLVNFLPAKTTISINNIPDSLLRPQTTVNLSILILFITLSISLTLLNKTSVNIFLALPTLVLVNIANILPLISPFIVISTPSKEIRSIPIIEHITNLNSLVDSSLPIMTILSPSYGKKL